MTPVRTRSREALVAVALLTPILLLNASPQLSRTVAARSRDAAPVETVRLEPGTAIALTTPPFIQVGKRYAFTWAGGGPSQTHLVKSIRSDGWILVDVAEDVTNTLLYPPGEFPSRWLNVGLAISIQEMRPLP
jgi:hypothetical protein